MVTRREALLRPETRREALLKLRPPVTRRQALLKRMGPAKRLPTPYYNKKGRQFFLTRRGTYVVRYNGKSLYGRKCTNLRAPLVIRPKKTYGHRATKIA